MDYKQVYEYKTLILTLNLEPGWVEYKFEESQIDDPLTFIKGKNSVGALQISLATAHNHEKFDINEQLKRSQQEYITEISKYNLNEWTVYEYEDRQDGRYIKFFHLTKQNVIVFVTYNCILENFEKEELTEAVTIIRSISVTDKN